MIPAPNPMISLPPRELAAHYTEGLRHAVERALGARDWKRRHLAGEKDKR